MAHKFFAAILLTFMFGIVQAECTGLFCTDVYIQLLSVDSGEMGTNDVWIQTTGTESALSCTANGGTYLKLSGTATSKKEVLALLTTAIATDRAISIRIVENSADCRVAYVYFNR